MLILLNILIIGEVKAISKKAPEIPENLPLVPFESSPHIWSFSKYKSIFHKDEKKEEQVKQQNIALPVVEKKEKEVFEEEIIIEKEPLTRGDESLVFLASGMLLVIILILGYMYSNGRL